MNVSVLVLALIGYYALHSILASSAAKHFLEPLIPKKYYRLFFNLVSVGLLIVLAPLVLNTLSYPLFAKGLTSQVLGGLILVSGLILGILSLKQYDLREFAGTKAIFPNNPNHLQISGLNSIVRHPLYLATLLILWGWFLWSSQFVVFIIGIVSTIYIFIGIYFEELKLVNEFGEDYKNYQKEVKMILPYIL